VLDSLALFMILVVLWIGGRFLSIHWLWGAVASGRVSNRLGQVTYAATLAVLPLLPLPWVPWAWPYVVAAAIVLFLAQLALSGAYLAFLRRNS
jgi:hypothetical protein